MARSIEETRRDFLIRLAKASAFVPPAVFTLAVEKAAAQQSGKGGGGKDPGPPGLSGPANLVLAD